MRSRTPALLGLLLATLLLTMAMAASADAQTPASAIIDNGTVQLGVNSLGHLNVPGGSPSSGTGTSFVGLRYRPTNAESTAPGCLCEGWGAADATSGVTGYANIVGGTDGLSLVSFDSTATTAVSVVDILGTPAGVVPTLQVTHDYHPSPVTPNLYEVAVTIKNVSDNPVEPRYRRVMDWDIEPTAFAEHSTIDGSPFPNLLFTSNDGFASANPLSGPSDLGQTGFFTDVGPADHGALFDFGFDTLAPGASVTFFIYYGAAGSEADALTAVGAVGAETWSLGQPSTADGPTLGTPNTFIFAFSSVGGAPVADTDARPPVRLRLFAPPALDGPGEFDVGANLKNVGSANATNVSTAIEVPVGLTLVSGANPREVGTLAPGAEADHMWVLRAPATCEDATYLIKVTASFQGPEGGEVFTRETTRELLVPGTGPCGDTDPPETAITSGPDGLTRDTTPQFAFSSEEGASFECSVDSVEAFEPCESPREVGPLSDGPHVFRVRAVDAAGNRDPTPASRSFTIDATEPETSIASGPDGPTSDTTPQFAFSSEEGASFECSVDSVEAFEPCESPREVGPLSDGPHVFRVRAVDAAGNRDPTPASRGFTIDTTGPSTTITSGPADSIREATSQFAFTSSEPNSTFECRVDGGAFAPCSSPFTTGPLSEGAHTFEVRATDALGNTGPVESRSFARDVTPPATQIVFPDEGATRSLPLLVFVASEDSTFECRVDGGAFEPCTSPYVPDTSLSDGPHAVDVRATDAAGNVGPVSRRSFVLDTTPPAAAVASGPSGTVQNPQPTFQFSSSEPGSTFECRVDGGPFAPCSSPFTTPALPPGPHTVDVRARDAAGNRGAPASRSFTVAAPAAAPPQPTTGSSTPPPPPAPVPVPLVPGLAGDRDGDGIPDADDTSDASVGPTLAKTMILQVVSGEVFVRRPAGAGSRSAARAAQSGSQTPKGFMPLKGAEVLPVGTIVHAVRGRLALTSAASLLNGRTRSQRAEFYRGVFQIRQKRARLATTDIALRSTNFVKECGGSAAGAGKAAGAFDVFAAQARKRSKKVVSRLWGNGKGRFRTTGRHSAATVRGTIWLTEERCDGTLTRVTRGVVSVFDKNTRRTVTVRAGRSYLARAIRATVRTRRPASGTTRTP